MKKVDTIDTIPRRASFGRAIRHSSFVILLGLLCLLPAKSFAQSSNRWLFIFNTSSAMRERVKGMEMITYDLLNTAMHGNMKAGDTIGIWTFNTQLSAEEAPLQEWSPAAAQSIVRDTLGFIDKHSYEKSAAFDDVLVNMLRVIKNSESITVILVSDGADPINGTPFDARITAFYKTNYQSQKKAKMPVVTLFRGEKGIITANSLAVAPSPLDIPAVPVPPVVKAVVQKPAPVAPPKPVPSLVIIGKKAETTFNPPMDLPEHVEVPTLPAAAVAAPVTTPEAAPAPKVDEKPAPVVAPVAVTPTPAPTPVPVIPTPTPAPVVEAPKPVQPAATVAATATASEPTSTSIAPTAVPPVQTATAVPNQNLLSVRNIAIGSIGFTALVCGFLLLTARNARNATRASLITRSFDRERK
jgi:hypothetical protein